MPASPSSITTREDLRESIINKNIFPIYLFHGNEAYLIDEMTVLLIGQILNDSSRNFNYDVVDEADARDVISLVTAFPLESERRVVVVKDFEKIEEKDLLIPLFEKPVDTTVFILRTEKPDFRTKVYKALQQAAVVVKFRQLYENEITSWIRSRVKKEGKEISTEASELLQSYIGRSLREVSNEIDKLFIFVGDKTTIDDDDVSAVVGMSREYNIFELQRSIGKKDLTNTLKIMQCMLDAGVSPIGIVSMLTKYFMNIWVFQEVSSQKYSDGELVRSLKLKDFALKEYHLASQLYSSSQLENCFQVLLDADEALKTSRPPSVVLSLLGYAVIRGKPESLRSL